MYPIPADIEPDPANPRDNRWFDWCVNNWGTKWDVTACDAEPMQSLENPNDGIIIFNADSAWSPPLEAFRKISKNFPTLTFETEYDEPSCDFAGTEIVKAGKVLSSTKGSSPTAAEWAEDDEKE